MAQQEKKYEDVSVIKCNFFFNGKNNLFKNNFTIIYSSNKITFG